MSRELAFACEVGTEMEWRIAAGEEIIIMRHGRPAGVLMGSGSEDDWLVIGLKTIRSS